MDDRKTPTLEEVLESLRRLREDFDLLEAAIDGFHVPITVVDHLGRMRCMNKAARDRVPDGFTLGVVAEWEPLYLEEDGSPLPVGRLPLARALACGQRVEDYPMSARWTPAYTEHMRVTAWQLRTPSGRVVGAMCTWPTDEEK